jgi:hypothetical protein
MAALGLDLLLADLLGDLRRVRDGVLLHPQAHPVVLVELGLLLLRELTVRIVDLRRVLDLRLRERHAHALARRSRALERDE